MERKNPTIMLLLDIIRYQQKEIKRLKRKIQALQKNRKEARTQSWKER